MQVDEEEETSKFNENEKRKRSNNIPPVDIWTKTQNATQQIIRSQLPNFSCTFSIINKTKMRVFPKTSDIRSKLLSLLDERFIEYNTYTPLDQKMQNVLLKGTEIDNEDIIREALEKNNIQPHKIRRFETGYMRKNNLTSNIWQIVLKPNTDLKLIFNIKYVAEWSVKWELMRKRAIIQCKRCQRLNHSSSNCKLPFRCVKCTNKHEPGDCPCDSSINTTKPKCVNCDGEHTANNATLCPAFKKEMQIREERKQGKSTKQSKTNTSTKRDAVVTQPSKQMNYAEILKGKKPSHLQRNTNEKTTTAMKATEHKQSTNNNDFVQIFMMNQKSLCDMFQAMIEKQNEMFATMFNQK